MIVALATQYAFVQAKNITVFKHRTAFWTSPEIKKWVLLLQAKSLLGDWKAFCRASETEKTPMMPFQKVSSQEASANVYHSHKY